MLVVILAALAGYPIARLLAFVFSGDRGNTDAIEANLHNPALVRMLAASAGVALVSTAFAAFVGYAISRAQLRRGRSQSAILMFTALFGGAMLLLPLYFGAVFFGLIPRSVAAGVIYALVVLPFCIARLKIAADTITPATLDAARVDGCSSFDCFRFVVLPSLMRALVVCVLFCFVADWNLRAETVLHSPAAAFALLLSVPLLALVLFLSTRSTLSENHVDR